MEYDLDLRNQLAAYRPLEIEMIRDMARNGTKKPDPVNTYTDPKDAFVMKSANTWMADLPKGEGMKRLFGTFWFENEVCIMFADTNTGKSILAVQIGESIASGQPVYPFEKNFPVSPVLYFDFELSDRQFEQRYTVRGQNRHPFSEQFYRVVPNPAATGGGRFKTHAEYLMNSLENKLITSKVKVVIIDNLNCLCPGTNGAAVALKVMQQLQALKTKYGLSVLVLAHTPKRNSAKPITRNDLQGSKMLINFCDSAFAIGESCTVPGVRYLKQIKTRSAAQPDEAGKVWLRNIYKRDSFLQFDHYGTGFEHEHLQPQTENHRKLLEQKVLQLHEEGVSNRQIGEQLGISAMTVGRVLKRLGVVG